MNTLLLLFIEEKSQLALSVKITEDSKKKKIDCW